MKLSSNNLLETLSNSEIENLTNQVRETLATNTGFNFEKSQKRYLQQLSFGIFTSEEKQVSPAKTVH